MPGSVQNAVPTTVMPASLCRAFARSQEYRVEENSYKNGESQRRALTSTSRKTWRISKRLPIAAALALREFYDARCGSHEPFCFYDPYETSPRFTHAPTGQAVIGRYVVRFASEWSQEVTLGRVEMSFELIEVG